MVKIPRYEDYAAREELNPTMRIPSTQMIGGEAVGRALQNLGSAVGSAGRSLGGLQEKWNEAQEKRAAYDLDRSLERYRQTYQLADEAAVSSGASEQGLHEAGVNYMTPHAEQLNSQIQKTYQQYPELAARAAAKKETIDLHNSAKWRQDEFKLGRQRELEDFQTAGQMMLSDINGDPGATDILRKEFGHKVDNSTHLTPEEKERLKAIQDKDALKRELQIMHSADPLGAAAKLGMRYSDLGGFDAGKHAPSLDQLEQIEQGIAKTESGGRYNALGPVMKRGMYKGDRAYGKYQVMGKNIPQWSEEAMGRRLTPQEFLNDPAAQDKVFRHRMGQYLRRFGNIRDAASMWFTGRPYAEAAAAGASDGFNSVQQYVSKVEAAMGDPSIQVGEADERYANLTVADRYEVVNGAADQQNAQIRAAAAAEKQRVDTVYDGAYERIVTGQSISPAQIDALDIPADKRESLITKYESARKEEIMDGAQAGRVAQGGAFALDTKAQKESADRILDATFPEDVRTGSQQADFVAAVRQGKRLPKSVTSAIDTAITNKDAQALAKYLPMIAALEQEAPGEISNLSEELRGMGALYSRYLEIEEPVRAAELVAKHYDPEVNGRREDILRANKSHIDEVTSADWMVKEDLIPPPVDGVYPAISGTLTRQWKDTYTETLVEYGGRNAEFIMAEAKKRFQAFYGEIELDGTERHMRYPPQHHLPTEPNGFQKNMLGFDTDILNNDHTWIERTIINDIIPRTGKTYMQGSLALEATPETQAEIRRAKANEREGITTFQDRTIPYQAYWVDQDGNVQTETVILKALTRQEQAVIKEQAIQEREAQIAAQPAIQQEARTGKQRRQEQAQEQAQELEEMRETRTILPVPDDAMEDRARRSNVGGY